MNLWIRSQDKERLTCCCDLRVYYDDNKSMWAIDTCDIVGYYASKERALEILDEIQNKIKCQYLLKPKLMMKDSNIEAYKNYCENLNNINILACDNAFEIKPINTNIIIYEMPKE